MSASATSCRSSTAIGGRKKDPAWRRLWTALREIDRYLSSQSTWLVNYAERHRAGLRVGTSLTEATANFLVNRRMNKSQQMRWSRRGADLLLQVRCAVLNGKLGSGFGQLFKARSRLRNGYGCLTPIPLTVPASPGNRPRDLTKPFISSRCNRLNIQPFWCDGSVINAATTIAWVSQCRTAARKATLRSKVGHHRPN